MYAVPAIGSAAAGTLSRFSTDTKKRVLVCIGENIHFRNVHKCETVTMLSLPA